ncbi:hypothetical protein B0H19DRAFT_1259106 [Mycena capillaripes]|nr:hypothetical protein B0H19DRAFT_1259106 [Mycena capillaripes]
MNDWSAEEDSPADEAAAAKLWAVYVSEAEKYDKALVESWRSDMEGMLIFAGLFSASLTAFLIESYRTLVPDPGSTTVVLLTQILHQLAASANGTTVPIVAPAPFTPSASSIGFKMHTVVEIIPLLLHTSVLFFFAGLIAFLFPVNTIITVIACIMLGVMVTIYAVLTLLPVFHLDCPYRAPLSDGFWHFHRMSQRFIRRWHPDSAAPPVQRKNVTMVETVFRKATEHSKGRSDRDTKALLWTLKSLTDDMELEPFIEAIPSVLWGTDPLSGTDERRYVYDDRIRPLMENPEVRLLTRIESLLETCDTGLLAPEISGRRRIACYKALWALSSLAIPGASGYHIPYYISRSEYLRHRDPEAVPYAASASAMQQWANFHSGQSFDGILKLLNECKDEVAANRTPDFTLLRSYLSTLNWKYHTHLDPHMELHPAVTLSKDSLLTVIETLLEEINGLSFTIPFRLTLDFIDDAQILEKRPYQFTTTYGLISPKTQIPLSTRWLQRLQFSLDHIVSRHLLLFQIEEKDHWLDAAFRQLVSFWYPIETVDASPVLPWAVIEYLNSRKSEDAVQMAVRSLPIGAWKSFAETIHRGPTTLSAFHASDPATILAESLTTVWKLYFWSPQWPADLSTLEAIFEAVNQRESPSIAPSVVAMSRRAILVELAWGYGHPSLEDLISRSKHRIFPADTSCHYFDSVPEDMDERQVRKVLRQRGIEGMLNTLSELIECCCSCDLSFKATETIQRIGSFIPQSPVHPTHELRFATAIKDLFNASVGYDHRTELLNVILTLNCFDVYAPGHGPSSGTSDLGRGWLDNSAARETIKGTFMTYLAHSSPSDNPKIFARLQTIVVHLDILHQR